MGSESIALKPEWAIEGLMGYWLRGHEEIIVLVKSN